MEQCKHSYRYLGLVYHLGDQRPGSGAQDMVYEDKFFCEHCLHVEYRNSRVVGHSYQPALVGALPK